MKRFFTHHFSCAALVDKLWDTFWNNGISNPLSVIEQVSCLLFIKQLDEKELANEKKARGLKRGVKFIFGKDQRQCCWSYFKEPPPEEMLKAVRDGAFPFGVGRG